MITVFVPFLHMRPVQYIYMLLLFAEEAHVVMGLLPEIHYRIGLELC